MENIIKTATEDTPYICFKPEEDYYEISGKSLPENALDFYDPIIEWLNDFKKETSKPATFLFKLDYFNTTSAKQIAKIFLILEEMAKNIEITVNWHYKKEDTGMLSSGERYAQLIEVTHFNFIEE